MSSRPFNTSTKNPTSVKLRGLQTSKAVTRQLEVDSRRMEDRLRELKATMNREKEERESRGSSSMGIWASGQKGAVTTHGNEVMKKKKSLFPPDKTAKPKSGTKGRKIKVLKDSPIEVPQRPKFKLNTSGGDTRRSFKGPACGQCEEKAVALTCMECGENYCTGCFAKFHMKGALKNHRSVPYISPTSSSESIPVAYENGYNNPRFDDSRSLGSKPSVNGRKSTTGADSHTPRDQGKVVRVTLKSPAPTSTGGALLQGDYDEQESANSFAAALAEWRQGKKTEGAVQASPDKTTEGVVQAAPVTPRGTTTSTSEGTSTSNGDISPREIEIKFKENSSLSYADRLLLKKHRRTELPDASSPNLMGRDAVKENMPPVNAWKKDRNERDAAPLVNGEVGYLDDELEDEHQSYVNIFSKRVSSHTPNSDSRPESALAISEVTEDDEHLEVSSSYSVQEGPDNGPVIEQPDDDSTQLSDKPKSAKKSTKPETPKNKPPNSSSSSGVSSAKTPITPSPKTKDNPRISSSGSRASSKSARTNQSAGKATRDLPVKSSDSNKAPVRPRSKVGNDNEARMRPRSKASTARNKDAIDTPTTHPDRPVSVGLTSRPSDGLKQVSQQRKHSQHQYKEGLGEFFTAGLTEEEKSESSEQVNKPGHGSSVNPSTELPECTLQGSTVWRPDSSLAATSDEAQQIPYTPSPPPPKSSSSSAVNAALKPARISPVKQHERNPETGSPVPEGGDPCKRLGRGGGAMGGGSVGMTSRGGSSRASNMPDRSVSRIDVDGDDMTGYDEDAAQTHREISADDRETLEQLTWELASQEGRITADGRITSMSMLEDEEGDKGFGHFSHDAELGILQDDGHGSGLSTPCEVMTMEREALSEEDLLGDFEDIQMCKDEVEALR
ncbi:LOW QUALITY PROTEIN: uncharacterized protein [Amphiura filiformis]|uniref:LOW QUALITY PROTEIN: uncharacterized protein n=1 Tax=Amphiura filiformis TaxID=82378 RepID=UPI003B222892